MLCRHLPPDVREGIMQQAAELAGLDVEDIFHDAQEAPAAEIEVQQERNFWQQIVTTALQFGGIVVIGVLAAAARGGGANAEQRRNRPGVSSNRLFPWILARLCVMPPHWQAV